MNQWTRRQFLIRSGVTGAAALALGATATNTHQLLARAAADPLPAGTGVLVIVTLYGGNDGLNTVIPYADSAYQASRPGLAYSASEVIRLDTRIGLNPGLTGLANQWKQGGLAIVHGVGYPNPDHSHFRSMDIWQTASPDSTSPTGWIGRWLDATGDDPLRAVGIGTLPPLAVGARAAAAELPYSRLDPIWQPLASVVTRMGQGSTTEPACRQLVRASYQAQRTVESTFVGPTAAAVNGDDLKNQLAIVGMCIKAGVPTRVYCVSMGGFDTHQYEKNQQQAQLAALDGALTPFLADMAGDPRGRGVVTMVYSEFGRRVRANSSYGTDHGTAGPVLLAGTPVRGGFYSTMPSLTDLDNGDLKANVDFRAVYGELLARLLTADPAQILGADRPALGFLNPAGMPLNAQLGPALTVRR